MWIGARCESSSTYGRICFAPSAQLMPTLSKSMCETEIQNASMVCQERVRPLLSVIVPDTMIGTRCWDASKYSSMANSAAFAFSVSKTVSTRRMSTPPSKQPRARQQTASLFVVDLAQLIESDAPRSRTVHILRHRCRAIGGPHRAGYETLTAGMGCLKFVGDLARNLGARHVERVNVILQAVIERRNRVRVERVGLDDIGAGFEILPLNGLHDLRLRDIQHVVGLAQILRMLRELGPSKGGLVKLLRLDHRAHGAIQNDDPLLQEILQRRNSCLSSIQRTSPSAKPTTQSANSTGRP